MHMSFPPSLVVIVDSRIIAVIAWNINIHYKLGDTKVTDITASRAYLLQGKCERRRKGLAGGGEREEADVFRADGRRPA